MKFDPALMARLQAATQELMKDGPLAATAAIRQALAGGAPSPWEHTATPRDHTDAASPHAPGGPAMKDLNPPPEPARTTSRARRSGPQRDATPPAPERNAEGVGAPRGTIADLLAQAGIATPAGLQHGTAPDIGELLAKAGIALPEGLKHGNLPGARRRPPPPPLPDGARFDSASFTCHAGTRGYKLYVPSTYTGAPVPLIVMLHGCTQDPDDFAAGTRMNQVAEETGCLVAYPAQTQQANSSRCWNWFSAADQQRGHGEPAVIAGIARQVMADYAVAADRVAIAGLSAGGAMAVIVAALYPELFSAVGVHSGLPFGAARDLPSALQAMKQGSHDRQTPHDCPPIIVFHGDKDHTVHARNGADVIADGLARHGAPAAEVERGKAKGGRRFSRHIYRNDDGGTLAEHWVLHGGGHAWAGGSASGSYTDGTGPDASREMVRFFADVTAVEKR